MSFCYAVFLSLRRVIFGETYSLQITFNCQSITLFLPFNLLPFFCTFWKEYTLAHVDKPDTLDGAEKALKKHEDFVTTMDANEEKILSTLKNGQRLVDSGNLYSGRVKDKMGSIEDRSVFLYYLVYFTSKVRHRIFFCDLAYELSTKMNLPFYSKFLIGHHRTDKWFEKWINRWIFISIWITVTTKQLHKGLRNILAWQELYLNII